MGFDLSRQNGEQFLEGVRDVSRTPQDRARAAMRLHMFPSLTEEVLALGRDPDLPELTSYWVGDAAFSLVMHWHLPPDDTDFAGFAAGATSRVRERMEHLRSKLPEGWTIERVRGVTGDEHAELRPLLGAVHLPDTDATMKPRTIISVRGRFLLCSDAGGEWYVGQEDKQHWFTCEIGPLPDLDAAIRALTA